MKTRFVCRAAATQFAIVLALLFCKASFAADGPVPSLSVKDRMYAASRIYASLDAFAHWQDVPGLDVDAAYRAYLDKALAAEDRAAFARASMEFLAGFKNAHTLFIDMNAIQEGGNYPFVARWIGGQWVVAESMAPELEPGDVIDAIDGQPFEEFYKDLSRMVSASTEAGRRRLLFSREPGFTPYAPLFPKRFVVTLAGGRKVAIDRSAVKSDPLKVDGRWLAPGKMAYIRIPSFWGGQDFEKQALALAREYSKAEVLIVDVRGNPGGATPGELTAYLMDRPYRWWSEAIPMAVPSLKARAAQGEGAYWIFNRPQMTWQSGEQQPAKEHFAGKLVLLVDAGCMSACEDFSMPFKTTHRAVLVGETTSGSSGQPYIGELGNGMMFMIGAKREIFPDGSPFEGVGIKPDVEAGPTVEDLRAGKDPVLEAAKRATLP